MWPTKSSVHSANRRDKSRASIGVFEVIVGKIFPYVF
jgi:hypothetical protein